jgi:hypothetical protein
LAYDYFYIVVQNSALIKSYYKTGRIIGGVHQNNNITHITGQKLHANRTKLKQEIVHIYSQQNSQHFSRSWVQQTWARGYVSVGNMVANISAFLAHLIGEIILRMPQHAPLCPRLAPFSKRQLSKRKAQQHNRTQKRAGE